MAFFILKNTRTFFVTISTLAVTKASGELAVFSEQKLCESLRRSGANTEQIQHVIQELKPLLYEGISTKKIFRYAFRLLKKKSRPSAAKYHLKKAIMDLGPSGYPFEIFVGEILRHRGFSVKIGQIVQGHCVEHEVDIVGQKDDVKIMVECKYHNFPGIVSDIKIPLYIHSRFNDVVSSWRIKDNNPEMSYQGWIVTNTRFSGAAITYGACAGLILLAWDYPAENGLKDWIDRLGLYPITCLTSLSTVEKKHLLELKIVLCSQLRDNPSLLDTLGASTGHLHTILREVESLCMPSRL